MRHKEGFGARLLLASMIVAVLSVTAPATSFAQKDVDPARLAAAKELLVVVGSARQFDVVVPLITQQLENAFVSLKPDHAAEIKDVFRAIPEKFSQRKQELLDQIAALYAEKLTADDINEIIKFYKNSRRRQIRATAAGTCAAEHATRPGLGPEDRSGNRSGSPQAAEGPRRTDLERAYPILMASKAGSKFLFYRASYRKTA